MALQYNKAMFDAAGIAYPDDTWTWDDLRAAAEALTGETADGQKVLGLVTPPNIERWLPFLYQAGGSVLSEDWTEVTLDSDEAREALDFYVGMVVDGLPARRRWSMPAGVERHLLRAASPWRWKATG